MTDKENCSLDGLETLGRDIISKSRAKRASRGKIPRDIFGGSRSETNKISVNRLDVGERTVMVQLSRERAANIVNGKEFYGWAVLKVEEVTSEGTREVIASPLPLNPYHADIILLDLPDDEDECRMVRNRHYIELASMAQWEIAPGISLE